MCKYLLICIFVIFSSVSYAGEENWYQITIKHGCKTYDYYGTTKYDTESFISATKEDKFIKIDNLVYFDNQNRAKSWSEWQANLVPEVYVKSKNIISFYRLKGDPRKIK